MKLALHSLVALHLLTLGWAQAPPVAAPPPPQVCVVRTKLDLDPAPVVQDGTLVGPWGQIARAMGARVTWYGDESLLVIVGAAGRRLQVQPGQPLTIAGEVVALSPAATLADGKLIGPVKPLVEALDGVLQWEAKTQRATIYGKLLRLATHAAERGAGVSFVTSVPVSPQLDRMSNPRRSFVDLAGVYVAGQPGTNYVNLAGLLRVRAAQYADKPPVARVVLDLREEAPTVKLQPREDDCGGRLVVGEVTGKEPLVERLRPRLLKLLAGSHEPHTLTVTAFVSDPLPPVYDVLRGPYRVLLDLSGAEAAEALMPAAEKLPFVQQFRLLDPGRVVLYVDELVPFTVRALTDPDRLQIVFARDRLAGKRIVVDPGHGGKDCGARGSFLLEKDVNLDMAKRTVVGLAALGARPFLTRDADFFVDPYARPRMANELPADLFVSIHCNATGSGWRGSGTGTYYYRARSKGLAVVMQDTLVPKLASRDYGVHCENFCVTRETNMPAILIETLFIDNRTEEKLLAQPQFRQQLADGVCEGLRRYLEGTKSVPPATLVEPSG